MNTKPTTLRLSMLALALLYATVTIPATANEALSTNPYAGQQSRSIKGLSAQEIADLQAGKGMGFSTVAELNHVPGPNHVVTLADQLALSARQKSDAQAASDIMAREAKRLGAAIVEKEAALDQLFLQLATLDSEKIRRTVSEIARLQGELRFVHLDAHVAMSHVLSSEQIAAYDHLRGYGTAGNTTNTNPTHQHHH